tara:strand:- start:73 stop:1134 length:1062 start_codon:yes stop_codon:yes gene_type:complete
MSINTYCNPSLIIDNREVDANFKASIDISGNNIINKCNITIFEPAWENSRLFKKEIQIYLNLGSIDSVPIFRGYITSIVPGEKSIKLNCLDPRYLLSGKNALKVTMDDFNNYDGATVSQFTYKWIKDKINTDKIYIGLDMLKESFPSQPLSTSVHKFYRNSGADAYSIIVDGVSTNIDSTEKLQPKKYEIVMIDDGRKANICFLKDKDLNLSPSLRLSFDDGLIKVNYKKEPNPTFVNIGEVVYKIGNQPLGPTALESKVMPNLEEFKKTPANAGQFIIEELEKHRVYNAKKISVVTTKGHYLSLGDIVYLDVEDREIRGPHKVTSKKLSIGGSTMNVNLTLNKRMETLSDVI